MKTLKPAKEIFANCTSSRVRMVARSVSSIYDQALAKHDVTTAQMNMLVTLAEFGVCAPRKIGEFLQLERSTVSRNLDHLMRKNLVEAISSDAKGIREISITADGMSKIEDILPDWRKAQKEAAQLLGQGGVSAMHEAADSIWSKL